MLQFLSVQLCRPAVVLLLGVLQLLSQQRPNPHHCNIQHLGGTVLPPEEGEGLGVPPQLHLPELLPRPVSVEVGGPAGEVREEVRMAACT